MNCCDANGQCKGGQGCPIGDDLPVQVVGPEPPDDVNVSTGDWLGQAMILAVMCAIGFILGFGVATWIK